MLNARLFSEKLIPRQIQDYGAYTGNREIDMDYYANKKINYDSNTLKTLKQTIKEVVKSKKKKKNLKRK